MSLASQAVLVRLSVELFQQATTDKAVTQEVNDNKKAARKAGRYVKQLFTPEALEGLVRVVTQARSVLRQYTAPWPITGVHMLVLSNWGAFSTEMFRLEQEFAEQREAFIENYPNHIAAAREKLGDLFNEEDYPTVDDLRFSCVFRLAYMQMPGSGVVWTDLEAANEAVRQTQTQDVRSLITNLAEDLYEEVRALHEQLQSGERFRVERVEKVRALLLRIKQYNAVVGVQEPALDEALEIVNTQVIARLDAYVAERESRTRGGKERADAAQAEAKDACYKTALDLAALFS